MSEQVTSILEPLADAINHLDLPADDALLIEAFALMDRLNAKLVATVGEHDAAELWRNGGATSMTAWLRHHTRQSSHDAARCTRTARRLHVLPVAAGAYRDGVLPAARSRPSSPTSMTAASGCSPATRPNSFRSWSACRWRRPPSPCRTGPAARTPCWATSATTRCRSGRCTCPASSTVAASSLAASTPRAAPSSLPPFASPPPPTSRPNPPAARRNGAQTLRWMCAGTSWTGMTPRSRGAVRQMPLARLKPCHHTRSTRRTSVRSMAASRSLASAPRRSSPMKLASASSDGNWISCTSRG